MLQILGIPEGCVPAFRACRAGNDRYAHLRRTDGSTAPLGCRERCGNGQETRLKADNFGQAFSLGAGEFQRLIVLTVQGFGQLVSNFKDSVQQVAGPVKIVEYGAAIARNDAGNLFQFAALISINLAVINILPLPALDGGQLVFLLIEALVGKPLPTKLQDNIMQTGLVLLLGLGVFLIVRDTANLAVFQDLFQ